MPYGVAQYAEQLGVSRAAAYKRLRSGRVGAYRVGSQWVVPDRAVAATTPTSRPMSAANAVSFLAALSGGEIDAPDPVARRRIREKVTQVRDGEVDLRRLWSWVRGRGPRLALSARVVDIPDLIDDPRLVRSGIVDPRARLAPYGVAEGYVSPADGAELVTHFLLVESDRPNVWLHVADVPRDDSGRIPVGFVIADLLDHGGARELRQASVLLGGLVR